MSHQIGLACTVFDLGEWTSFWWYWKLNWRRNFFSWEEEFLHQLEQALTDVSLVRDEHDS
ncbi:hypothetical protein HKD37_17G047643 [Glycine soja]